MRVLTLNEVQAVSGGNDDALEIVGQILFEVFVEVFAQIVFELLIQSMINGMRSMHDYFYPPVQTTMHTQFIPS